MGGQSNPGALLDKRHGILGRQLCGLYDRGSFEQLDASVFTSLILNPFRPQVRRRSDIALVAIALLVVALLVLWAAFPR